jgi:hypothetical protein
MEVQGERFAERELPTHRRADPETGVGRGDLILVARVSSPGAGEERPATNQSMTRIEDAVSEEPHKRSEKKVGGRRRRDDSLVEPGSLHSNR